MTNFQVKVKNISPKKANKSTGISNLADRSVSETKQVLHKSSHLDRKHNFFEFKPEHTDVI